MLANFLATAGLSVNALSIITTWINPIVGCIAGVVGMLILICKLIQGILEIFDPARAIKNEELKKSHRK